MFQLSPTDSGGDELHLFFFLSLILSSVSPPGQGAITRLCLQRTPDQTVTASGSRRAPRAFDSTDRLGLCSWREERSNSISHGQQCILKTVLHQCFFFFVVFFDPAKPHCATIEQRAWGGGVREGNALSSLTTPSLLTLWSWTSSALTVMIPLRTAPSAPPVSSAGAQLFCLRTPKRRLVKKDVVEKRRHAGHRK